MGALHAIVGTHCGDGRTSYMCHVPAAHTWFMPSHTAVQSAHFMHSKCTLHAPRAVRSCACRSQGLIQTVVDLSDGSGVAITVARCVPHTETMYKTCCIEVGHAQAELHVTAIRNNVMHIALMHPQHTLLLCRCEVLPVVWMSV